MERFEAWEKSVEESANTKPFLLSDKEIEEGKKVRLEELMTENIADGTMALSLSLSLSLSLYLSLSLSLSVSLSLSLLLVVFSLSF